MRIEPTEFSAWASDLDTQANKAEVQAVAMAKNTMTQTATQARTDKDLGRIAFNR